MEICVPPIPTLPSKHEKWSSLILFTWPPSFLWTLPLLSFSKRALPLLVCNFLEQHCGDFLGFFVNLWESEPHISVVSGNGEVNTVCWIVFLDILATAELWQHVHAFPLLSFFPWLTSEFVGKKALLTLLFPAAKVPLVSQGFVTANRMRSLPAGNDTS